MFNHHNNIVPIEQHVQEVADITKTFTEHMSFRGRQLNPVKILEIATSAMSLYFLSE